MAAIENERVPAHGSSFSFLVVPNMKNQAQNSAFRTSLVSSFILLASLVFGGCAVDAEGSAEESPDEENVVTQTQALSLPTKIKYVAPECQARLLSTTSGPSIPNANNTWGCASADPYTGQKRYAGELESGLVMLLDEAKRGGQLVCTAGQQGPICTITKDRLVEKLCTETRTYECPCGVVTHQVDGYTVGACRNIPQ